MDADGLTDAGRDFDGGGTVDGASSRDAQLDAGPEPGDADTLDAGPTFDAGDPADAGEPGDAGTVGEEGGTADAGAAACDSSFSTARNYQLCFWDDTSCSFNVQTSGRSCVEVCEGFGSTCIEAFDNGAACEVLEPNEDTCGQTGRSTEICRCART